MANIFSPLSPWFSEPKEAVWWRRTDTTTRKNTIRYRGLSWESSMACRLQGHQSLVANNPNSSMNADENYSQCCRELQEQLCTWDGWLKEKWQLQSSAPKQQPAVSGRVAILQGPSRFKPETRQIEKGARVKNWAGSEGEQETAPQRDEKYLRSVLKRLNSLRWPLGTQSHRNLHFNGNTILQISRV